MIKHIQKRTFKTNILTLDAQNKQIYIFIYKWIVGTKAQPELCNTHLPHQTQLTPGTILFKLGTEHPVSSPPRY